MARTRLADFLSVVLVVCLPVLTLTQDCVSDQPVLTNTNVRDKGSPTFDIGYAICDQTLAKGWYSAGTSRDLATTCPPHSYCGTIDPIWMNGTIPLSSEGIVQRTACVVNSSSCCATTLAIRVYNCGSYRLFDLPAAPPPGCSAYCIEPAAVITTSTITTSQTTATNVTSSANSNLATTTTAATTTASTTASATTVTAFTTASTTTVTAFTTASTNIATAFTTASTTTATAFTTAFTTASTATTTATAFTTAFTTASTATTTATSTTASTATSESSGAASSTTVSAGPNPSSSTSSATTRGSSSSRSSLLDSDLLPVPLTSAESAKSQSEGNVVTVIIAAIAGGLTVLVVVLVAVVVWYRRRPRAAQPGKPVHDMRLEERDNPHCCNSHTPMDEGEAGYTRLASTCPLTVISEAGYMDMNGMRARPQRPQSSTEEGIYSELPAVIYANDQVSSPSLPPALPSRGVEDDEGDERNVADYDDFTLST